METRTEVRTFKIEKFCDKCLEGKMIFDGASFATSYVVYSHKCDKCNHSDCYKDKYPKVEYELC